MFFREYLNENLPEYENITDEEYEMILETLIMDLIETLEETTDEQDNIIDEIFDLLDSDEEYVDEGRERKRVVRGGKVYKKIKCTNPNQKVVNGRCVRISQEEKRKRARGAKKAVRKRRAQKASIQRHRKKSIRVRNIRVKR